MPDPTSPSFPRFSTAELVKRQSSFPGTDATSAESEKQELDSRLRGNDEQKKGSYELVLTQAQFDAWLDKLRAADLIAFDTETTSLDPMRAQVVGVSFAVEPGHAGYVPVAHEYAGAPAQLARDGVLAALKPLLEDASKDKVGQHLKYDMNVLSSYAITMRGVRYDSMLESYVFNASAIAMTWTRWKKYLDYDTIAYNSLRAKGAKQISFARVDVRHAADYAAGDADVTLRLRRALWRSCAGPKLRSVFQGQMHRAGIARMEQTGVRSTSASFETGSWGGACWNCSNARLVLPGATSASTRQNSCSSCCTKVKLPVAFKTPSEQQSTTRRSTLADQHELPRLILDYRSLAKLRSAYTDKLASTSIRAPAAPHELSQAVAATGRLSSNDRICRTSRSAPRRMAHPPGVRGAAGLSHSRRRLFADRIAHHGASVSDQVLLAAFHGNQDVPPPRRSVRVPPGRSIHQRRAAKAINFGLMYGMSAFGLARQLSIDRGEAAGYMKRYFERYPGVQAFMSTTREQAHRDGYVETLFGRRLYLYEINSRNQGLRAGAERAAINAPMQGTAADIIKRAMITVDAWLQTLGDTARMIMQVHDELVFEVKHEHIAQIEAGVRERMAAAAEIAVPLVVDVGVGDNWDEAH